MAHRPPHVLRNTTSTPTTRAILHATSCKAGKEISRPRIAVTPQRITQAWRRRYACRSLARNFFNARLFQQNSGTHSHFFTVKSNSPIQWEAHIDTHIIHPLIHHSFFLKYLSTLVEWNLNVKSSKLFGQGWLTFLLFNSEYLHHGVGEYNANLAQNFILASQKFYSPKITSIKIPSCVPHAPEFVTSVYWTHAF